MTISINWIRVGSVDVSLAGKASDLSVWLDTKLTLSTHINKMCGAAFFYLYNIPHIRKFLSKRALKPLFTCSLLASLITATVYSTVCSTVLP